MGFPYLGKLPNIPSPPIKDQKVFEGSGLMGMLFLGFQGFGFWSFELKEGNKNFSGWVNGFQTPSRRFLAPTPKGGLYKYPMTLIGSEFLGTGIPQNEWWVGILTTESILSM